MKAKKIAALLMASIMVLSMIGCGDSTGAKTDEATTATVDTASATTDSGEVSTESTEPLKGKLVVWTLAADLEQFSAYFMEKNPGVEVETVVIAPADYPTKVQTALLGGEAEPDIIVGEPQMLEDMYDAGFFEDLNQAPYNAQDYADKVVDYVWKVGQDSEGIQRAISYQITPAGFYYRRDIAETVFGTSDPVEIGKLFKDYDTILQTGETLKNAGYRIFASDAETNYFSGDSAWVIDGALNVDQARYDYMDLCVALYQNDMTAFASQWAAPWYQAMQGPVPLLTAETQWGTDEMNIWDKESFAAATEGSETVEVFSYGLPAWGVLTMRDNVGDTAGKWGVCAGPSYGFGGGTFIGISANSERKDLAWQYLKFCTLTEDTMEWWIEKSQGDTVSYIPTLEAHAEDANEIYGGEQLYKFWLEQAKGIDYSKVTRYDKAIGDAWGAAITAVKTGEKTKDEAITEFYDVVESTYPEITVNR